MHKPFTSIPVIGARNAAQMSDSLLCTELTIPENMLNELNEVSRIELGFPHDFLASKEVKKVLYGDTQDLIY